MKVNYGGSIKTTSPGGTYRACFNRLVSVPHHPDLFLFKRRRHWNPLTCKPAYDIKEWLLTLFLNILATMLIMVRRGRKREDSDCM